MNNKQRSQGKISLDFFLPYCVKNEAVKKTPFNVDIHNVATDGKSDDILNKHQSYHAPQGYVPDLTLKGKTEGTPVYIKKDEGRKEPEKRMIVQGRGYIQPQRRKTGSGKTAPRTANAQPFPHGAFEDEGIDGKGAYKKKMYKKDTNPALLHFAHRPFSIFSVLYYIIAQNSCQYFSLLTKAAECGIIIL